MWRWLVLALVACSSGADPNATIGTVGAVTTPGGDPDPTTGSDPGPSASDPTPGATGDTTGPTERVVRFVALGDAGEGNTSQFEVADAIEQVCGQLGCDFALYLGDNFYDTGVDGVDDPQFIDKFELPYANLDFPFYVVMGNHDLGLEGLGVEFWKADYYVDYTDYSDKWTMPAEFYTFDYEHVRFYAIDTTDIFFGFGGDQQDWLDGELALLTPDIEWTIAFGHHPYISNGQHGNAGNYEGIDDWIPLTEIPRGEFVQEFIDESVCGQITVYLSGHDHNRQFLKPTCGTEFIVSGAGAKTTDLEGRGNDVFFEDDTEEGFLWVEIRENQFTGSFYDKYGNLDYTNTFTL